MKMKGKNKNERKVTYLQNIFNQLRYELID